MKLNPIDHSDLTSGTAVYYGYTLKMREPTGPFKVKMRSRDHSGEFVMLTTKDDDGTVDDRRVSLADDEDYGLPIFYTITET